MRQATVRRESDPQRPPIGSRLLTTLAAAGALFAVGTSSVAAHHGWSSYDSNSLVIATGVICEVRYANPHVTLYLEVPLQAADGGAATEMVEVVLAPPSRLQSRGLSRERLLVGVTVTVEGYPSVQHEDELRAERIAVDGESVELR